MSWYSDFEPICRRNVPLRDHTWYRLGGPADYFFTPRDESQLAGLVACCNRHDIPWRILGRGANVLACDEGLRGAVIHLAGPEWERIEIDGFSIRAAAGADLQDLIRAAVASGLAGIEGLAGIPASIGGAVRMNAGGRYGSIADHLRTVRVLGRAGGITDRDADTLGFGYRTSNLDGDVATSATFHLTPGDTEALQARYRELWQEKAAAQPAVAVRSAGCIFKNAEQPAGLLLDQAGLKGHRVGGAEISTRHANFILAHPDATARDVLDLITIARERVREHAGVTLQLEVDIW